MTKKIYEVTVFAYDNNKEYHTFTEGRFSSKKDAEQVIEYCKEHISYVNDDEPEFEIFEVEEEKVYSSFKEWLESK